MFNNILFYLLFCELSILTPVYDISITEIACLHITPNSCLCSNVNQVCWYWRYLSELDQLWMPKCVHFGWYLSFIPSPYENGVWKRNFIEQFKLFQVLMPKVHSNFHNILLFMDLLEPISLYFPTQAKGLLVLS